MRPNKLLMRHVITEAIDTIERLKPESLVYCTGEVIPALEALNNQDCIVSRACNLEDLENLPRFELGIIFDYLEQRQPEQGTQFLCRLRNVKCEKLWVAAMTSADWNFNTMISLGFERAHCYVENNIELCTYSYDIATYNRQREWNNPRFWANPENWGKYRW